MRSLIVASTVLAFIGFGASAIATAKAEETFVVKRGHDRDRDWHRGWHRERGEARIYIGRRDHDRDHFRRERRDRD
jgi:hypothetical protein